MVYVWKVLLWLKAFMYLTPSSSTILLSVTNNPMHFIPQAVTYKQHSSYNYWSLWTYSLCSITREATAMRSPCTATREQSPLTATRESLCSNEDPMQSKTNKAVYTCQKKNWKWREVSKKSEHVGKNREPCPLFTETRALKISLNTVNVLCIRAEGQRNNMRSGTQWQHCFSVRHPELTTLQKLASHFLGRNRPLCSLANYVIS